MSEVHSHSVSNAMISLSRPSSIYRPQIIFDPKKKKYVATVCPQTGSPTGVTVEGDTPDEAMLAFDNAWLGKE